MTKKRMAHGLKKGLKQANEIENSGPKVLIFDVETSYLETNIKHWNSHTQDYIPHDKMTIKEWSILTFSAKWLGKSKVIYVDTSKNKDYRDDKNVVLALRDLLDESDIIITKNGKRFDEKMFNARCVKHGISPPSPYKHIDTEQILRRKFKLVSYSLDYACEFFNTKHKKLKHGNFPGMKLWEECIKGNKKAWAEMKKYNIWDILSTEDLYNVIQAWDNTAPDFNLYKNDNSLITCNCGSSSFQRRGYNTTKTGKHPRLQCKKCGKWHSLKHNAMDKERKKILFK